MQKRCAALVLALGLCAASPAAPAPTPQPFDAAVRARVDADVAALLASAHGTGASISIAQDGTTIYARGYGLRDLGAKLPADSETHYEIGSITKQFTAAAVLQLRDAGKLSLDAKLATYLPSVPHASDVTIRQLLTHTSGLHEYLEGADLPGAAKKPVTFDGLMARIAGKPLDFPPGTKWAYSNTNYVILGELVQTLSHEPYERYLREHIFAPAGMTETTTMAHAAQTPDTARGYVYANGKTDPAPALDDTWAWSAGAIVSTAGDLQKWNAALGSGKVVSAEDYALMKTPQRLLDGRATTYGFGLMADTSEGQPRIWHNGGTFGFASSDLIYPAQHLAIVALSNDADGPAMAIAEKIFDDLVPEVAATLMQPVAGEDPAVTARVKAFIVPALQGKLDRSQVTDAANKAVSDATMRSVAAQFAPLGAPTAFIYKGKVDRPAGPVYVYLIQYPSATLKLTVQIETASDKFSVFYVSSP